MGFRQHACLLAWALLSPAAVLAEGDAIDFNRHIRPLLADVCYQCHGPDEQARQADLRLDTRAGAVAVREGRRIVVPGKPDESELYRRLVSADPDERMPPAEAERKLTAEQIELIRRWIEQGADWQDHWAFIPPKRPPPPAVKQADWPLTAIDTFVLARLEAAGLSPAPEADRPTLIRRVSLDLTGLPPTPQEVDAFLADVAPGAYERLVDRLLASPRFGEHMAVGWLDAARYADTSGYQNDGPRQMWRWRDWVIEVYNANMPFDQFTVEQLAGDLLPAPTLAQRIATGFNRNHRGNAEGGIIPEEYQVEYVVDRVETMSTVFLGLTLGCGRCHDHKYDPFTQRDFYGLFAYFNNIPEYGRAIKEGNSPPLLIAPTPEQQRTWDRLKAELAAAQHEFDRLQEQVPAALALWEASLESRSLADWNVTDGLIAHFPLDGALGNAVRKDDSAAFEAGRAEFTAGRIDQAAAFDGSRLIRAGDVARFGYFDKFSLAAWVRPDGTAHGTIISRMTDVDQGDGYQVRFQHGRLQVNLVKRWLDDAIRVETRRQFHPHRWYHVLVTYDGSRTSKGVSVYVDGRREELAVHYDFLNQSFSSAEPLRIGAGGGPESRFRGAIDEVRIYNRALTAEEAEVLATVESLAEILSTPPERRTDAARRKLREYFLAVAGPDHIRGTGRRVVALQRELAAFVESLPTVMVMEEMPRPRDTHLLIRGQYDQPGPRVEPGIPAVFGALDDEAPRNRLALARWIVDPANPLTARVAVNRIWQLHFGSGLVQTAEDFGAQGEPPSHPELLDWLATEFIRTGWDVKGLHRLIVTSATYRQSAQMRDPSDPDNRMLARGPRFRLAAQLVRDQALAAAELLTERLGGPSVKPYQPQGLWQEIATDTHYEQDHGPDLYRRSVYTYWKRTVANPTLMTFDASARETCAVRRPRTNTPLQALAVLNDVTFVEAARVLAQNTLREAAAPRQRLRMMFRRVTARFPSEAELGVLSGSLRRFQQRFSGDREAAGALLAVGEFPRDESLDVAELAAYTAVGNLILNLDEALTRE